MTICYFQWEALSFVLDQGKSYFAWGAAKIVVHFNILISFEEGWGPEQLQVGTGLRNSMTRFLSNEQRFQCCLSCSFLCMFGHLFRQRNETSTLLASESDIVLVIVREAEPYFYVETKPECIDKSPSVHQPNGSGPLCGTRFIELNNCRSPYPMHCSIILLLPPATDFNSQITVVVSKVALIRCNRSPWRALGWLNTAFHYV